MNLIWHQYKYYPYERELAAREVAALSGEDPSPDIDGVESLSILNPDALSRLTYFAGAEVRAKFTPTQQFKLEDLNGTPRSRQSTRYSVHGLHDYKGKFNPQVAKAMLNIFGMSPGSRVFDPFCGSGTTLVECAHLGIRGDGSDINPLAVFIANTKLRSLGMVSSILSKDLEGVVLQFSDLKRDLNPAKDSRRSYLESWFDYPILSTIEHLRRVLEALPSQRRDFFLVVASNLLREYSGQEPADLRIRRRKSPLPTKPFIDAFSESARNAIGKLKLTQAVVGLADADGLATLCDVGKFAPPGIGEGYDAAITSPPYATALPYIDTQRLSLVWLGQITPEEIAPLEARLIGSREFRAGQRRAISEALKGNLLEIPDAQANYCIELQNALTTNDGFRRQMVPHLTYRYFGAMRDMFSNVRKVMKASAPFALVVGANHTVLGGVRFDIDTPNHLAELAQSCGWTLAEKIPLQTYRRYGLHSANAIESETLVVLRA